MKTLLPLFIIGLVGIFSIGCDQEDGEISIKEKEYYVQITNQGQFCRKISPNRPLELTNFKEPSLLL